MDPLGDLIGEHPTIVALRQKARALLPRHQGARRLPPILIQGETGTGKGLLARLMHRAGPRAAAPFVELNCAAIPETLLEAELFGYERGAFTDARQAKPGLFHVAHGGTLFLDEVALLPRGLQPKLLTVLEQGSVRRLGATRSEPADVSILAATNASLRSAVAEGRFRADLYHRLAVLTLELPPLRERDEDIDRLAERLLARACAEYGLPTKTLADDARIALRTYTWPGNVRELGNVIERAVLLSDHETITADGLDLPRPTVRARRLFVPPMTPADSARQHLLDALTQTGWNITRTAARLGITRNTVRARIRLHGLRPPGTVEPAPVSIAPPIVPDVEPIPTVAEHAPAAASIGVRWDRRRVTFLRARIVPGPDGASSVTSRVFGWLVDKAQTFGGHVTEIGQQSVVAIFGHVPAEDAPRRAATAALALTKLIAREDLRGEGPDDVSVALAIHVDRVALAHVDGRPVVEQDASRRALAALDALEPIASGEIAVTDAALGFLTRHFEIAARPDPGAGRQLVGRASTPGGSQPVAFVGRRAEMDTLRRLLDQATLGHGQIVTIVGEPGIGKSRLLQEFQQSIGAESVIIREGRCAPYGAHVPYFPAIEILQAFCDVEDTDSMETVDAAVLASLQPLGPAAAASAPYLQNLLFPRRSGELSGRSPDAVKTGTFEAVRRVVLAQQERRALLLVIEDLHWIDQTSAELLTALAELTATSRVLLVTTARPGYRASWQTLPNATQITLGPLSAVDSRRLVESVLAARPAADEVVGRVLDRGEGNPFFLEELAQAVREHADEAEALAVPGTVHDVVASRVDSLPTGDRHVLEVAAVIGREIPVALLQEASELSVADIQASLARLQTGEFLHAIRSGTEAGYAFKHALTHEVAYDGVVRSARAVLHARVVSAIGKLAPEIGERRPETLARHCTEAGRHTEAIAHWTRAGQLAIQRSAHGDAIVHLGQALALLANQPEGPARDAQEIGIQLAMATSVTAARGYGAPEIEQTLDRVRVMADRLTDVDQKFFVQWTLWRFQLSRADFRAAEQLVGRLLAVAQGHGDTLVRVGGHVAAGVDTFYRGEFARAREHLGQAAALDDRTRTAEQTLRYGQDMGVAAAGFLGWADAVVGDLEGGARRAELAVRMAREGGHPFNVALALFLACEVHELRREPDVVRRLGDELVALSREYGFTFFVAIGLSHAGWGRSAGGDVDSGAAMMQEGADLFRRAGQRVGLAHRARLAEGLLAIGAVEPALQVIADALEQRRQTEEHAFVAPLLTLRAEALVRRGETAAALSALREAVEVATRQGATLFARDAGAALRRLENRR
ncbi:MAG TPA: sigma 54-interacting transcriptional regulator [Methylomirabilota bacterium]|nr:sigma 54-interacting transcriptional regulator [Methylomirabilota bacterium]